MEIIYKNIEDLKEYENNPRINNSAVDYVSKSIEQFGFRIPIVIDKDDTIVCGHARYKACKKLDIYKIPCVIINDLTEEQIKAFRLIDNKSSEQASWDFKKLELEIKSFEKKDNINIKEFNFVSKQDEFFNNDIKQGKFEEQEDNEEYNDFVNKFKEKHTTDDCYTPTNIYDAVVKFVENEYKVDKKNFVRPFYPGGDYRNYKYKKNDIVVDNPPFSIYSEIVNYYTENNIKFFIFGPGLTILSTKNRNVTYIIIFCEIAYQNGAKVNTSFVTNLDKNDVVIRTANEFAKELKRINQINTRKINKLTKYDIPKNVIGVSGIQKGTRGKEDLFIKKEEFEFVDYLYKNDETKIKQFGTKLIVCDKVLDRMKSLKYNSQEEEEEVILKFNNEQEEILKRLNKKNNVLNK